MSVTINANVLQITRCDQRSSRSGNDSEIIKKFVTPAICISMTFQDLRLIPGLFGPGKCDF